MTPMMWATFIVLAIAVAGSVVGLLWLRRTLTIEPDVHSFRATSPPGTLRRALVGVGLVAAVMLLMAIGLRTIRLG